MSDPFPIPETLIALARRGVGSDLLAQSMRAVLGDAVVMAGGEFVRAPTDDEAQKPIPVEAPSVRFIEAWERNVRVEQLRPGDHLRHPLLGYGRKVVSIKPHPKGGVQVKTAPTFRFGNRCSNAAGKTLKHNLTGFAERWDGKTMIEDRRR